MTKTPTISAVIGSFNRYAFLKGIIESVRTELEDIPHEIIVVDGGSTDSSLEWLLQQKDVITIVQHNRGIWQDKPIKRRSWGYFTNLAFKAAEGKYILMLSDDCLLIPGSVDEGLRIFENAEDSDRKLGGVAFYWREWPRVEDYSVTLVLDHMMINHGLFLRSAVEEIGWIEEDLFDFYHADSDLALKLWNRGYAILDSPNSLVEHHEHVGTNIRSENITNFSEDWNKLLERWKDIFYHPPMEETISFKYLKYQDQYHTAERFHLFEAEQKTVPIQAQIPTSSQSMIGIPDLLSRLPQINAEWNKLETIRMQEDKGSERIPVISQVSVLGFLYRTLQRIRDLGKVWSVQSSMYRLLIEELDLYQKHITSLFAAISQLNEQKVQRQQIESRLQNQLNEQKVERQQIESRLQNQLNEQKAERQQIESHLQNQLNEQKAERQQIENHLQNQLNEATREIESKLRLNTSYVRMLLQEAEASSEASQSNRISSDAVLKVIQLLEEQDEDLRWAQGVDFSLQIEEKEQATSELARYFERRIVVMLPAVWYHFQSEWRNNQQLFQNAINKIKTGGKFVVVTNCGPEVESLVDGLELILQSVLTIDDNRFQVYIWQKIISEVV